MIIKKLHLVYFSPTGTGKKNLEFAAANFNIETIKHDITCKSEILTFKDTDLVFFITPVYSGRVPTLAKKRIELIHGNNTPCVLFSVYGNRAFDNSLIELQQIVENNDFKAIAALGVIGEHTFTNKVGYNRPDADDQRIIGEKMNIVKEKINKTSSLKDIININIPGKIPNDQLKRLSLAPKTNDKCTHCNICIDVCPAKAINFEHFNIPDSTLCIGCLACVKNCPNNAREANQIKIAAIAKALELSCKKPQKITLYI